MNRACIIIFLATILWACDKALIIPHILTDKATYNVFEEIGIWVEELEYSDGTMVNPDYYKWYVEDSDGDIVIDDFDDSSTIHWTPQTSGVFIIKVEIGYYNNHKLTSEKEISVN